MASDLTVSLKDWNQDANGGAGEFRSSYGPNYKERNAYLKELMHDIDSKIMDYIKQHGDIDGHLLSLDMASLRWFASLARSQSKSWMLPCLSISL